MPASAPSPNRPHRSRLCLTDSKETATRQPVLERSRVLRIVNIVGTRPNLVKMSSLLAAQRARPEIFQPLLVHTGQHHEAAMSGRFFAELALPQPDVTLPGYSGTQAEQVGAMVLALEPVLVELEPDLVLVVGDVNSTAAGALAAAMCRIPVAHVEAGLRSFDRSMPEELNRILVDAVSVWWFASEHSAVDNLIREGCPGERIHHVGNVMIDALVRHREAARQRKPAAALGISDPYAVLTLHRPSNVDDSASLALLLRAISTATDLPILFPVHPRTHQRLQELAVDSLLRGLPNLHLCEPLGYLDMLALLAGARLVLTDSGGVQEETTYLGIPCLTLRERTERPATVDQGTNQVIGVEPELVHMEIRQHLEQEPPPPRCPPLWDGHAAERIATILASVAIGSAVRAAGRSRTSE